MSHQLEWFCVVTAINLSWILNIKFLNLSLTASLSVAGKLKLYLYQAHAANVMDCEMFSMFVLLDCKQEAVCRRAAGDKRAGKIYLYPRSLEGKDGERMNRQRHFGGIVRNSTILLPFPVTLYNSCTFAEALHPIIILKHAAAT